MLFVVQLVHGRVSVDDVDVGEGDAHVPVSYCVSFSITQSPGDRVAAFRECAHDVVHEVGFDVAGFLEQLLLNREHELLGLHEQRPLHRHVLADVAFRKLIHWQRAHGEPHNFIPIGRYAINQLVVAVVQIVVAHVVVV